ncbi:hypothetical protein ABK040_000323 [Willaertia magna]
MDLEKLKEVLENLVFLKNLHSSRIDLSEEQERKFTDLKKQQQSLLVTKEDSVGETITVGKKYSSEGKELINIHLEYLVNIKFRFRLITFGVVRDYFQCFQKIPKMEKIIVNALPDLLKEEFTLKPTLVGSLNDNPPEQSFFVDISENKDLFEQALNNLDFTVDMCAALVVNDLLSLYDTFGNNHQNFGIYKKDNKFTFKFVDFLANGNNGFYSLVLKKNQSSLH